MRAATTEQEKIRVLMRIDTLCSMAMRDHLMYIGAYAPPTEDTDTGNVERVLREWQGEQAWVVAVWEMCSVKWVENARRRNGLNPADGEPRKVDERTAKILEMRAAGESLRQIAEVVGSSKSTVDRILTAA